MEYSSNCQPRNRVVCRRNFCIIQKGSQDSKFIYKRAGCPETHYADNYYTMRHESLFSNGKAAKAKK